MKHTEIKLSGLAEGLHSFGFQLNEDFLTEFSSAFFSKPNLRVSVRLLVSDTMLKAQISIEGTVILVCDRSLEEFEHQISLTINHFFNFGEEEMELSDELDVISKDRTTIDFDQLVYDSVALSIPGKKLHPKFQTDETEDNLEGEIIFSTLPDDSTVEIEKTIDPRWAKLKEINRSI